MILLYPGLFKNIPHVWFLRLYSFLKNLQHDFPKMRGGGQRPFGTFPKIHPFWYVQASLSLIGVSLIGVSPNGVSPDGVGPVGGSPRGSSNGGGLSPCRPASRLLR